ncbi:MAG: hypothetical protein HKO93_02725, partial [Flavobacteriales bacterium]|nr:hypothetical protein [Flavobacteriales bacterium]
MVLKLWKTYFALLSLLCSHFLSGQCLESYSWEFSPQQVDGAWGNEEVVNVCLILTHEDWQGGNHYLHSIIPEFGTGWDLGSIEYIPPLSSSNDCGYWAWYDNPITSEASGVINGQGFYYESPLGGTDPDNPGDNFGDRCPIGLQLEFCFQLTTLSYDECTDDLDLDISINTLSDDESGGAFLSAICQDDEEPILTADINCCNANAGEDLELSFCTDGPEESINEYLSTNNSGLWYYQSLDNPALGDFLTFSPGNDPDGTYLFVVSDELNECNDIAFVSIDTQDGYEAGVSGSTVICENGSIVYLFDILGSNAESGGEWTDPNGIPWNEPFSPSNDIAGEYTYSFPSTGSCPADEA